MLPQSFQLYLIIIVSLIVTFIILVEMFSFEVVCFSFLAEFGKRLKSVRLFEKTMCLNSNNVQTDTSVSRLVLTFATLQQMTFENIK